MKLRKSVLSAAIVLGLAPPARRMRRTRPMANPPIPRGDLDKVVVTGIPRQRREIPRREARCQRRTWKW